MRATAGIDAPDRVSAATAYKRGRKALERCMQRLDALEVAMVRRQGLVARSRAPRLAARILNRLADGWLYAAGTAALLLVGGTTAAPPLGTAGVAAALSFSIYPLIKRMVARERPFVRCPDIRCECSPLDRYSFPSGHSMTTGAVFVPVGLAFPEMALPLVALAAGIGWARLALGHHYPSDVAGGIGLGAAAGVVSTYLVPW